MAERLLRQPRVLFRVDGSSSVGMGHVFRSLAIAEAARPQPRGSLPHERGPHGGLVTVSRAATRCGVDRKEETYLDHIRDFAPAIINDLPAWTARTSPPSAISGHHREPRGHHRRPGDDGALCAGHRVRHEPGARDAGGLLRRPRLRDPARALPRTRQGSARHAAPRAPQLRGKRPAGPHPEGGARAPGPRPRSGAGGGGRPRLLLPARVRGPLGRAVPPRPPHQRGGRAHRGADAGGGRDGGVGRDVRLRDRRPGHAGDHPRPERTRGPADARFRRSRNRRLPWPRNGSGRDRPRLRREALLADPAPPGHERTRARPRGRLRGGAGGRGRAGRGKRRVPQGRGASR